DCRARGRRHRDHRCPGTPHRGEAQRGADQRAPAPGSASGKARSRLHAPLPEDRELGGPRRNPRVARAPAPGSAARGGLLWGLCRNERGIFGHGSGHGWPCVAKRGTFGNAVAGFTEGRNPDVEDEPRARDPLGLIGRHVGSCRIEALSSSGGFSVVYRAEHTLWCKPCAIKVFDETRFASGADIEALRNAFIQEAALLAELSSLSTSIVQAWDVGTLTGP